MKPTTSCYKLSKYTEMKLIFYFTYLLNKTFVLTPIIKFVSTSSAMIVKYCARMPWTRYTNPRGLVTYPPLLKVAGSPLRKTSK